MRRMIRMKKGDFEDKKRYWKKEELLPLQCLHKKKSHELTTIFRCPEFPPGRSLNTKIKRAKNTGNASDGEGVNIGKTIVHKDNKNLPTLQKHRDVNKSFVFPS